MQLIRFEQLSDTCSLQSNVIPAGHLQFYRDTVLLDELEFVLEGDCKGLYSDFTRTPRKYKLTVGLEKKLNELDPLKQVNNK
jgi:hypothetical protein